MNETDVCKAFVKAAFANRPMPNYGLIDNFDKRELIIRNLLWEAAGFKIEDSTLRYKYALTGIKGNTVAIQVRVLVAEVKLLQANINFPE